MKRPPLCGCCSPAKVKAVTIKGIDKTDGTTVWEYGPGSFWRHHYGSDAISGVVPNLSATLNKYAVGAGVYPAYNNCGNRNSATLVANAAEALTLTKLDSLDGTVIESAVLTGFLCDTIGTSFVGLMAGISISNAAALSGGDYVIVGERSPFIEFVSFASNTATKSYILHAHGHQAGNIYLKTRTSNETITIPQNATAAEVETLFEATSDCTAATVTGGPWPLLPITVEATWSVAGGDISAISATSTATATGLGLDYEWEIVYIDVGIQALDVTINILPIGVEFSFEFSIGEVFSYTSATEDIPTFLAALAAAMEAFAIAQGADGAWESVASGLPDTIAVTGNTIRITYSSAIGIHPLTVTSDGGEGATDSRRAGSCAAAYDTGTGAMTSAVGFKFGFSSDRTPLKMFTDNAALPTVTGLDVLGILAIGSGPSDSVIVTPNLRNNGDITKANVLEKWNIASGAWTFDWQVYCNAKMLMPFIIACESGSVICPIGAKIFDGARERTAAKLAVSDGARTELNTIYGSITEPDNWTATIMKDDSASVYCTFTYEISTTFANRRFLYNPRGADTWIDGDELRLGAFPFGFDSTIVYAQSSSGMTEFNYTGTSASGGSEVYIRFYAKHTSRSAEPQQFRFKLARMPGVNYTAWLNWYATESEIETALNNLLGTGNCSLVDLGVDPTITVNNPVSLIEHNPEFKFLTDVGFTPGSGRIPGSYFVYRNSGTVITGVEIEMQTLTPFATPQGGMAAYSITDATLVWDRAFGTKGSETITHAQHAWLHGDFVYAYGTIVDAEL